MKRTGSSSWPPLISKVSGSEGRLWSALGVAVRPSAGEQQAAASSRVDAIVDAGASFVMVVPLAVNG